MDSSKTHARFKVAMLRNPKDGDPKVLTYSISQFIKAVEHAPVSATTYQAYHFQKAEYKRLTIEARAAKEDGDIETAKELKTQAATYGIAIDRTKFGRAIMPFLFKDDIASKVGPNGRPQRDNSRITHFSLIMLDVESNTTAAELHDVLRSYEYVLWPTITHRPNDPRYRIVLFPDRPLTISEARALIFRIDARLPARNDPSKKLQNLDPSCADVGRLMFLPKWLTNHPTPYSFEHNVGSLITSSSFPVTPSLQAVIDARVAAAEEHRSNVRTASVASLKIGSTGGDPLIVVVNGKDYLNPGAYFETEAGYVRLSDVTTKIGRVRCPFHDDGIGSEFIAPNWHTGRPQLCCAKCGTFHMAPPSTGYTDHEGEVETDSAAFGSFATRSRAKRSSSLHRARVGKSAQIDPDDNPNVHYFDTRYLPDLRNLVPERGLLFIRSPKGTGKTQALVNFVQCARTEKQSVLLLTHRRSLARNLSLRLGLANYQDLEDGTLTDFSVVCVNSLPSRFDESRAPYDIVIVDESEQVLRNLLSSTLQRDLSEVFRKILLLLMNAKRIVCLDADLSSDLTIDVIAKMRAPRKEEQRDDYCGIINEYKIGQGKKIRWLPSRHQLLGEISRAADAGKKIFIACSTARAATVIGEVLKAQGKRALVITANTSEDPDVVAFLQNPNDILKSHRGSAYDAADLGKKALNQDIGPGEGSGTQGAQLETSAAPYDAVVASPSLQTGFSIDVPYFDAIYGWFQSVEGITYQDYDQALSRVRHCDDVTVWIEGNKLPPRIKPPELFVQHAIWKEMKERKTLPFEKRMLTEGERLWVGIEGLITYLTATWSYNRDVQFRDMKSQLGFTFANIDTNPSDEEAGKLLWGSFKDVGPDYPSEVFHAAVLDPDEYLEVQRRNQKSNADHLALKRYRIAAAIPDELTLDLVAQAVQTNLLETVAKARSLVLDDSDTRAKYDIDDRRRQHMAFTRAGHRTFEHQLLVDHLSNAAAIDINALYDQLLLGEQVEIPVSLMDRVVDAVGQRPEDFRVFFGLRVETIDKAVAKAKATAELSGAEWTPAIETAAVEEAKRLRRKRVWDGTFKKVGLPLSKGRKGPRGKQVPRYYIDPENPKVELFLTAIRRERDIREEVNSAFAGIERPQQTKAV